MQAKLPITSMNSPVEPIDYAIIFNALPNTCVVLSVPDYRIVAVTDAFCRIVYRSRGEVLGVHIANVLPHSPSMPHSMARSALLDAIDEAVRSKKFVSLGIVRYDIVRPINKGSGSEEHWWRISDTPVVNERGEVAYVIHLAEEVSQVLDVLEELELAAKRRAEYR